MTVGETLNQGIARLQGHDCPDTDPIREAQALLSQVLGLDLTRLALEPDRTVSPEQATAFNGLLNERLKHRPLAYLLGSAPFLDFELTVTPDTLIPRPATETLAQAMITELVSRPADWLVDVGTGSGCLAIAAARSGQAKRITAMDLSEPALSVARQNAARLLPAGRTIEFLRGDLLEPLFQELTATDVPKDVFVVANLPYLPDGQWADLTPEIRDFEPRSALTSGPDGLDHYRRLIDRLAAWTTAPPGQRRRLLLEILPEQYEPLAEQIKQRLGLTARPIANESGIVIGLLAEAK